MVKLIIQIPCLNEQETIGMTLDALPRAIDGVDIIETLIINDGSTDRTVEVAQEHGVDHVIDLRHNRGLASAFIAGLDACVCLGADIIVNTDADNQYCANDIATLVSPILNREAEMVVGARSISTIRHFSRAKKVLQRFGSRVVRFASGTTVPDAPSGFRAFTRDAAMRLNVFSEFSYTLETLIQAGQKNMAVASVPVRTNDWLRDSRLFRSLPGYIRQSASTIFRIFVTYRPVRFFWALGGLSFGTGFLVGLRYLFLFLFYGAAGHVQSLILAAVLLLGGLFLFITGIVCDLIAVNRKLLERVEERMRRIEFTMAEPLRSDDTADIHIAAGSRRTPDAVSAGEGYGAWRS